jgi:hypothetical protein
MVQLHSFNMGWITTAIFRVIICKVDIGIRSSYSRLGRGERRGEEERGRGEEGRGEGKSVRKL